MVGRGNTVPVYPWFGKDIRQGVALALENYNLVHRLWREGVVDWKGEFRQRFEHYGHGTQQTRSRVSRARTRTAGTTCPGHHT